MTGADSAPRSKTNPARPSGDNLTPEATRALVEMPQLLTVAEAARVLRVHRNTVTRELRAGRLGCVRIGRRVLVRAEQLRRYVEERSGGEGSCNAFLSIDNTGWRSGLGPSAGTSAGADRARDALHAVARAQRTWKKPSGF